MRASLLQIERSREGCYKRSRGNREKDGETSICQETHETVVKRHFDVACCRCG